MDRADADAASDEGRPDAVPVVDLLEADQFPADLVGAALIHQDAAGDRDAGTLVLDTFVFGEFVRRHGLSP
mgnify:CR=1 FL=1